MNTLNLLSASEERPITRWLPQTGGLLAAAVVAFTLCRPPLLHTLSWGEIVSAAIARVLAVFAASAATALVLYRLQPWTSAFNARRLALRTSLDALWLAPLALFIRENSAWTIAMAAVLAITVTRSLYLLQDPSEPAQTEKSPDCFSSPNPFGPTESSRWFWRQLGATGAALCAQTGALAAFAGLPFTAATLVGISFAGWTLSFTWDAIPDRTESFAPSQSTSRMFLVVAITVVFMVGGLIRYLPNPPLIGAGGVPSRHHSHRAVTRVTLRGEPGSEKASESGEQSGQPDQKASEGSFAAVRDAHSGVILWPKEQMYTKLVAPAPAVGNGLLNLNRSAKPLTISFNGVYWFFKAPDVQPPTTSRQAHGSPELLDIHSTDRHPLSMEAHENFGSMIDLDCCSRIQIAIRNADLYPETVSLELILVNSSLPGKPSLSLGTIMAKSTPSWRIYERPSPTSETLNFPIPANRSLHGFDEVVIVFRLAALRADDGAKIAIDHFVLVPRGL
jgi:hypothetical protein